MASLTSLFAPRRAHGAAAVAYGEKRMRGLGHSCHSPMLDLGSLKDIAMAYET